jgi:DNA-binding transcriptional LysR family regulator
VLPDIVRRYRATHPRVKLVLEERTTSEQIGAIESGRLDLGILRGPLEHDELETKTLARERLVAILPSNHALSRSKTVDPRALAREPFVLFPRCVAPSFHDALVRACGAPLTVAVEAAEWSTIVSLVAGGNGVSLGPESVKLLRWPQVAYRPVSTSVRAELLLCRRRESPSALVSGFLEACASAR